MLTEHEKLFRDFDLTMREIEENFDRRMLPLRRSSEIKELDLQRVLARCAAFEALQAALNRLDQGSDIVWRRPGVNDR